MNYINRIILACFGRINPAWPCHEIQRGNILLIILIFMWSTEIGL